VHGGGLDEHDVAGAVAQELGGQGDAGVAATDDEDPGGGHGLGRADGAEGGGHEVTMIRL